MAQELGVPADAIVFNGPNKSARDLEQAVAVGVGLLVVDGLYEIERLERIAEEARRNV